MFRGNSIYSVKDTSPVIGDKIAFSKPLFKRFNNDEGWHLVGFDLIKGTIIDYSPDKKAFHVDRSARYQIGRYVWIKAETFQKYGFYRKPWRHPLERELALRNMLNPVASYEYPMAMPTFQFATYPTIKPEVRPSRPVLVLTAH